MKTTEITKQAFNDLMFKLSKDIGFSRADDTLFRVIETSGADPRQVFTQLGLDKFVNESMNSIDKNRIKLMTEDDARIFSAFSMQENGKDMNVDLSKVDEAYDKTPIIKALKRRCDAIGVKLSKLAGIYISTQLRSFGDITMCAAYLYWQSKFSKIEEINMEAIGRIFPLGFPSEFEWQDIWDSQKVECDYASGSDNMLDYKECYK